MARMIVHPTFPLDEIGHAPRGPQARVVPERLRPPLEAPFDAPQIGRRQPWLAPCAARLLQGRPPTALQLLRPSAHRLAMHPDLSSHFRLAQPPGQQPRRLHSSRFQCLEIPSHSGWIPHASNSST